LNWWSSIPKHINPNIVEIGSFQLRYYGLMYVVAITVVYLLVSYRLKNEKYEFPKGTILNYFVWAIIGIIVGGRLGYVLFYDFGYFVANPLKIICPFDISNGLHYVGISGTSYHGGVIGVILASIFLVLQSFAWVTLYLVPKLGLLFGRRPDITAYMKNNEHSMLTGS
jgi:phosphatidylglycerol:prolipoprotein diacylglycerol transferase